MEDELQITLTNYYAFKRLLGSEENKPLLQATGLTVQEVETLNS
ncbi:MAG: hypothetical protein ACTTI6_10720 [Treponema sp.]